MEALSRRKERDLLPECLRPCVQSAGPDATEWNHFIFLFAGDTDGNESETLLAMELLPISYSMAAIATH